MRQARAQASITRYGAGAQIVQLNGTRPAGLAARSGNTVLSTGTFGAVVGTASPTGIDWDEAGITQNAALHVTGTPTFIEILTSAGVLCSRHDVNIAGHPTAAAVVTGTPVVYSGLNSPEGNVT